MKRPSVPMVWLKLPLLACFLLALSAPHSARGEEGQPSSRYWGAGIYMTNEAGTLFDHARWDWMVVRFDGGDGDAKMIEQVNQFLMVNPHQKYLIRLTPRIDTPDGSYLNFLHYRYDPEVRNRVQEQIREQIRMTRRDIARPDAILGYTFDEELPGNFGFEGLRMSWTGQTPPQVEFFRQQIEKERGQPLTWDEATWRWLGTALEQSLDEIHALIKAESGGADVLFWVHLGYPALEHADGPVDFAKHDSGVVPFSYANLLKPGRCDGILSSVSDEKSWARLLDVTERYNGILIAHLSSGGYMRLRSWDQVMALLATARRQSPQYAGYFFFCEPQGPNPLDKPDTQDILSQFKDRLVQFETLPDRGAVLKVTHPDDGQRPFIDKAASYLVSREHPTHGSRGLSVKGGQTLHWSVRVKTQDVQGEEGAVMTLVWETPAGGRNQPTVLAVKGTQDWRLHEGTITTTEDTLSGRVYLGIRRATGTAWFDDLVIKAEGSEQSLVENGSFEDVELNPLHWKGWIIDDQSLLLAQWRAFCEQQKIGNHLKPSNSQLPGNAN